MSRLGAPADMTGCFLAKKSSPAVARAVWAFKSLAFWFRSEDTIEEEPSESTAAVVMSEVRSLRLLALVETRLDCELTLPVDTATTIKAKKLACKANLPKPLREGSGSFVLSLIEAILF